MKGSITSIVQSLPWTMTAMDTPDPGQLALGAEALTNAPPKQP